MKYPASEKESVEPAAAVLAGIEERYLACPDCPPDPNLDKTLGYRELPGGLERCRSCGKATLDAVMLDALRILHQFGLRDERASLRSVGSPLVVVGYPLAYPPPGAGQPDSSGGEYKPKGGLGDGGADL